MGQAWYSIYHRFDDDTLAALANPGLVRRAVKDVEAGKVSWYETPPESAVRGRIKADGQCVDLDASGPQKAQCDCSAPGICKHIIAAVVWLRAMPVAAEPEAQDESSASPLGQDGQAAEKHEATAPDIFAELMNLDAALLFKQAGRSATRQAAEYLSRIRDVVATPGNNVLVIELPDLKQACRYIAGAGLDAMVSEAAGSTRQALHLAAILAVWRMQGKAVLWPDYLEDGMQEAGIQQLSSAEHDFLRQVPDVLAELCRNGLSHVSEATASRLRALNMSARAEGLPRLAAMLRNLAGIVDMLVRRDYRADESQAVELMAQIYALCEAMPHADENSLPALRGRLRRDFENAKELELLPLGAYWWETRGGARGLTVSFWDHAGSRVVQAALARLDDSDRTFDRHGAWTRQGLWPGAGPAEKICQAALRLENPRLSDDGRIGLAGEAKAVAQPLWQPDDERLREIGYGDWSALMAYLQQSAGLAAERIDCVLLRPQSVNEPFFNEIGQTLEWTLVDRHGTRLLLQLPCEEHHMRRLESIERLAARGGDIRVIVARVVRGSRSKRLEPVSLLLAEGKALRIVSLDFASEPAARAGTLTQRILKMFKARQAAPSAAVGVRSVTRQLMLPVLQTIERHIMTGRMLLSDSEHQALRELAAQLHSVGLDTVYSHVQRYLETPGPLTGLRVAYLCFTCLELDNGMLTS